MPTDDKRYCGAKTRAGGKCRQPPMANGRCRLHGGKSLRGIASPSWKTGAHSKYLPTRLRQRYDEAANDVELNALQDQLALVHTRVLELLERIDTGESGHIWRRLKDEMAAFEDANRRDDMNDAAMHLRELRQLINMGLADWAIWDEIKDTLELQRRLSESERKRKVEMAQMITYEKGVTLIARIAEIILKHEKDRAVLHAISLDIGNLMLTAGSENDVFIKQ